MISPDSTPSREAAAIDVAWRTLMARLAAGPDLDIQTVRDMTEATARLAAEPVKVTYRDEDVGGVPGLWCTPDGADPGATIVYLHGGGYNNQSKETVRKLAGHLARAVGIEALAIDYRLAPENPWPAALDDVIIVLRELRRRPAERTVLLAGESAGGSLALSAALSVPAAGGEPVAGVIAFSPYLDLLGEDAAFADPDSRDLFLSRPMAQLAAGMLLGTTRPDDPVVNLRYADPSGLPPLFLGAGGHENLADGVRAFAARARAAGVDTTLEVAAGMQHAHVYMAGRAPEADATIRSAGRWGQERLGLTG